MSAPPVRCDALARVELNVSDLERSRRFYRDIVGLEEVAAPGSGEAAFRCDARPISIVLRAAPRAGFGRCAWSLADEASMAALKMRLGAAAIAFQPLDDPACRSLGLHAAVRFVEPATGAEIECHLPDASAATAHFTPSHTHIQRLGHVVFATPSQRDADTFHRDVLDFRASDRITAGTLFSRPSASPWHHGLGLAPGPVARLHHVNFMVSDIDDIGRALHRLQRAGAPVVFGPGRHPASGSVFLYFLDPDGLTLEYSFGMEAFDLDHPRAACDWPAGPGSVDTWGAPRDARMGAAGSIGPGCVPD